MALNITKNLKDTDIGPIPLDWSYGTIEEIGGENAVLTGPFGSLLHASDYSAEGVPLILVKSFENGKLSDKEIPKVNINKANQLKRFWLKEGDIVFSRVGEVGRTLYIDRNMTGWLFSGQTLRIRIENELIFNKFVEFYLRSKAAKKISDETALGTTRPSINTEILRKRIIPVPPINEQKAIAKILSDLDSKIELNQKMNKTLEAIAQAIFRHWFIDFEFPNEEGKPYKSSGGEMVDSDWGEIPKGWKIGRLIDITLNLDSKRVPLSSREREVRTGTYPYYGAASVLGFVDSFLFDGIYLLVGEDGTVIDEHDHPILQYVFGRFWVNNHAHVIQGKYSFSTEYVYLLLKQLSVKHIVTGAVQAKINQANLNNVTVVMPPVDLINDFNRLIEGVFSKLRLNKNEMDSLTQLREILLPKLISGKIRVPLEE